MVEFAKLFALLLRLRQHGSHHTCSMNYTAFTSVTHWTVPFNDQFHEMASQSKLVTLPKLWRASCDPNLLPKENSEVEQFHRNNTFQRKEGGKKQKTTTNKPWPLPSINSVFKYFNGCFIMQIVWNEELWQTSFLLQWCYLWSQGWSLGKTDASQTFSRRHATSFSTMMFYLQLEIVIPTTPSQQPFEAHHWFPSPQVSCTTWAFFMSSLNNIWSV